MSRSEEWILLRNLSHGVYPLTLSNKSLDPISDGNSRLGAKVVHYTGENNMRTLRPEIKQISLSVPL